MKDSMNQIFQTLMILTYLLHLSWLQVKLKLYYFSLISLAYEMCKKPCIDVTFSTSVDKFYSERALDGCPNKSGKIMMQFSKTFEYEIVRFQR